MIVKVCDDEPTPVINRKPLNNNREIELSKEEVQRLERFVDEERDIKIKVDGKFIEGKEYFAEDKDDYDELFDAHYTKRIDNIKEYTNNIEEVENILEYAEDDGQPDSVLEDIEEYINELKE